MNTSPELSDESRRLCLNRVLVVESGAKTKTIRRFLRGEYDVVASGGHIADLPDGSFGIDIDTGFQYHLEPDDDKVEYLRDRLSDADEVYLATDPDREGEAIAADIRDFAVPTEARIHRVRFNAITYPVVTEALEQPGDIDESRVEAQRARRALDRLIGFILSSHAQHDSDGPRAPAVGRVQSPALRLVVGREREISAFESQRYWELVLLVGKDDSEFRVTLDGEVTEFEVAKATIEDLAKETVTVTDSHLDENDEQHPAPPYTTDSLQLEADYLLNLSPERTMALAQQLYEGVELDDGETVALITYMRTDSTRVSPSALNLAKEALSNRDELGDDYYSGRTWEISTGAQDAHEAIRPTHPDEETYWPERLEGKLDDELLELYRLIYWRFIASQMIPAVYRTTTLEITAGDHSGVAIGHELLEPGFLEVWADIRPSARRGESALPALKSGDQLDIERAWPELEVTKPPYRYREGDLIGELKERGIGRPSTYSTTISKIKTSGDGHGYVKRSGKTLQPTDKGEALIDYLVERFPQVVDYEYTRRMEEELDLIEAGELEYGDFLEEAFGWLSDAHEQAFENGWLSGEKPSLAQLEFLEQLAAESDTDLPDSIAESRSTVESMIDQLLAEQEPKLMLTEITEADVSGIDVYRFRLYYNTRMPDEEFEYLLDKKMKYIEPDANHPHGLQFQRQRYDDVKTLWEQLKDRYTTDDILGDFEFRTAVE